MNPKKIERFEDKVEIAFFHMLYIVLWIPGKLICWVLNKIDSEKLKPEDEDD